jgi:uncharacterized protein
MSMYVTRQLRTATATSGSTERPAGARAGDTNTTVGKVRRWLGRHGLLAYTLTAYAISWTLLTAGLLGTNLGFLDAHSTTVWVMIQVAAAGPLIAALVMVAFTRGRQGLASFGRSLLRWRVSARWYAFAFLGIPATMVGVMSVMHPSTLVPALADNWPLFFTKLPLMVLTVAVMTGLAEEPGWRGYAQPTANRRHRPLVAALIVSVIWALWHLPNALFGQGATETALHLIATTVNGFVLAWAYNATRGSVLIVMLLHGAQNATAGLVVHLSEESATAISAGDYYAVSALVFGVLMIFVALATRGRLGLRATPQTTGT